MKKALIQKFARLNTEDASVMTEFVILLPVFIITFVGIVNLTKLEVASARVKYVAATQMWDNAMAIHDNDLPSMPPFEHALPQMAAMDGMNIISERPSDQGDMVGNVQQIGLMGGGSRLEAGASGVWTGGGTTAYSNGSDFAEDMIKDTTINPLPPSSKMAFMAFNVAVPYSFVGTRQAAAIGTRYGMVKGEEERSVTAGAYGTVSMGATYDVQVSPTSVGGSMLNELIIVGFSRLAAEQSGCLKSVLKISNDADYDC